MDFNIIFFIIPVVVTAYPFQTILFIIRTITLRVRKLKAWTITDIQTGDIIPITYQSLQFCVFRDVQ